MYTKPKPGRSTIPLAIRFWSHVNKRGPLPTKGQARGRCWFWMGHRGGRVAQDKRRYGGYGLVTIEGGRIVGAHRLAWQLEYGPIGQGRQVLHRCDNPPCVRPSHLFLGGPKSNTADCVQKRRMVWQKRGYQPAKGEGVSTATATWAQVKLLRKTFRAGQESIADAAQRVGVTEAAAARVLRNESWRDKRYEPKSGMRLFRRHGAATKKAVLTWPQVDEIRRLYAKGGETYRSLAQRFKVSFPTIRLIVLRETWRVRQ